MPSLFIVHGNAVTENYHSHTIGNPIASHCIYLEGVCEEYIYFNKSDEGQSRGSGASLRLPTVSDTSSESLRPLRNHGHMAVDMLHSLYALCAGESWQLWYVHEYCVRTLVTMMSLAMLCSRRV